MFISIVIPEAFPFSGTRKWFFLRNFHFPDSKNVFSSGISISRSQKMEIPEEFNETR